MKKANETNKWFIYRLVNPSGKVYIGKTYNLISRFNVYRTLHCKSQPLLYRSLVKYGFLAHNAEVIETFDGNNEIANEKEKWWIDFYKSNQNRWRKVPGYRGGLNLTDGAEGMAGYRYSDESKKKMSLSKKGKPNMALRGYKHSKEFCERRSVLSKGKPNKYKGTNRPFSEESLQKLRNAAKGNTFNKGKKQSKECIEERVKKRIEKYGTPIIQLDFNGNIINEYASISLAVKGTGVAKGNIRRQARYGLKRNPRSGCIFKYKPLINFHKITLQRRVFKQENIKYKAA